MVAHFRFSKRPTYGGPVPLLRCCDDDTDDDDNDDIWQATALLEAYAPNAHELAAMLRAFLLNQRFYQSKV